MYFIYSSQYNVVNTDISEIVEFQLRTCRNIKMKFCGIIPTAQLDLQEINYYRYTYVGFNTVEGCTCFLSEFNVSQTSRIVNLHIFQSYSTSKTFSPVFIKRNYNSSKILKNCTHHREQLEICEIITSSLNHSYLDFS